MRSQHIGHGLKGYYKMANLALKFEIMSKSAKVKSEAITFWSKHGLSATNDAYKVSTSTLHLW